jgi:RNA polymerase sigma-70 factor (ECF subfamily)
MNDVFSPVELAADCAADMPGRPAIARFPDGQAADDGRLVRAAREGERSAFATLYDRYARVVHGVLLARVSRDDVEDLVQDVFLAAWRRLDDLRDPAAFGGWLTMIARNRATDFHRRSPAFVELPEQLPVREAGSAETDARAGLEAIRGLPDAYRETLVLRLVEGVAGTVEL